MVDPSTVAPQYREAAEKRRAEQIKQRDCAKEAEIQKAMPRERTTFLLQCLTDAEVAEAAKAADAPKAADAAKATEATMAQVAPPTLAPPTPTPTPSRPSEKIDRDWASWNWQQQQALSITVALWFDF